MRSPPVSPSSAIATTLYGLLDPIPFGFFVGALIFDAAYADGAEIMWVKGAAWLITLGLFFAIVPRLINLVRVWLPRGRRVPGAVQLGFWLHLVGIVAAIANAMVHTRDAYGVMPMGLWLSVATVVLLSVGKVVEAFDIVRFQEPRHE